MTSNSNHDKKGPGVRFPPPLIFLSIILAGYFLHYRSPLAISDAIGIVITGWAAIIIAAIVLLVSMLSFRRAKTSIEPWRPTSSIISSGIYGYSRNPIYLALCLATIGIGMILNSWWVLASFIPAVIVIYLYVIRREEAYLEGKFGEEYLRYKSRVRRWL